MDDRVRAIVSALGYRTIYWTTSPTENPDRDSNDAGQTGTTAAMAQAVLARIQSWFFAQPGFISLQHDNSNFTVQIAIDALNLIKANTTFPLKPQPVGQCQGLTPAQWYKSGVAPKNTTSSTIPGGNAGPRPIVPSSSAGKIVSGVLGVLLAMVFLL